MSLYILVSVLWMGCASDEEWDTHRTNLTEFSSTTGVTSTTSTTSTTTGTTAVTKVTDDCPAGVICVDTFPYVGSGDTEVDSTREFDGYACAPDTDESGPEHVYRVELAEDGFLALGLDDWDADIDVHLLGSLDANDCIDRGHWNAGALMPAGTYYVVVDSWVSEGVEYSGEYDIFMGHTSALSFEHAGLDREVLGLGLYAFDGAWISDETESFLYTIIDFSLPSTDKRQWTIDLLDSSIAYQLYVSHGEGSGSSEDIRYADIFSNIEDSHQSSLGVMRTDYIYGGDTDYSLKLDGLEPGINDNVRDRYIVVHGSAYSTQDFIDVYGYLGRSWGCPSVDEAISDAFIDDVAEGSLYWTYYPDPDFLSDSTYLP